MSDSNKEPYKALGSRIKHLREQWKQSLGEVSGTLEIDEATLEAIEKGYTLPPVEVLNMIIDHFLLTDDQAEELRHLALSHQGEHTAEGLLGGIEDVLMKQIVMYLPIDNRVVYTDSMNVVINKHGVVLQFMQASGTDKQQMAVSQVGMSRDHAEKIIRVLQDTLREHDRKQQTKLLPEKGTDSKKKPA